MEIDFDFNSERLTRRLHAKLRRITPKSINCRKLFTTTLLLSASLLSSFADTKRVDMGYLIYTVDTEAMTAEVFGTVSSSQVITDLVIPDYIDYNGGQIPVTSIRNYAFSNNKNLKGSLTIGNSVQTIGLRAFYQCYGFTGSLTIGNSVETIGFEAFRDCLGFTGSLSIPNSVQTIGDAAFADCSGFDGSLTISNSVKEIPAGAFFKCSGFTGSLTIPNSVMKIWGQAFEYCSGFTGLTIGNSVTEIHYYAFVECRFTGPLIIPNSVYYIANAAFSSGNQFTSLIIGNSVELIEMYAFTLGTLESVTCLATIPPKCIYLSPGDKVFHSSTYNKPFYVPAESVEAYKTATEWKKFTDIRPLGSSMGDDLESTGIAEIATDPQNAEIIGIYTLAGQYVGKEIERLKEGIYVVQTANGSYKIKK